MDLRGSDLEIFILELYPVADFGMNNVKALLLYYYYYYYYYYCSIALCWALDAFSVS
jgi:hypothetical protein